MSADDKQKLIESLLPYITQNKQEKIFEVIKNRTHYITVALEDIFQSHNASAVLRTCDIFGVQNVHVIESKNKFTANPSVAMGASKWVNVTHHDTTINAFKALKNQGYRIVATTPHTDSYYLPTLPLDQKTALIFGNEQTGLSSIAMEHADMFVKIPMYGFVESFNISVSVALCLYDIITRLHQSSYAWKLTQEEQQELMLTWIKKISKTAHMLADKNND